MGGSTTNKKNWPKQKQLMVFGSLMILGEMILKKQLQQGGPPTSYKWSYNPYK